MRNATKWQAAYYAAQTIVLLALTATMAGAGPVEHTHRPMPKRSPHLVAHWWTAKVGQSLDRAGANRSQLLVALRQVPADQRVGLKFLLENMPDADLKTLSAHSLLDGVALGYKAWKTAPWRDKIPQQIFLNDVLPYATLNEERDASRRMLREKSLPLIAGCRTPSEAAQRLNEKLFSLLNVRYSTERARADQSATQSMASGKASCSGLSILLVGACRAVGIPARVVGTPMWTNGRGNHTWVEIWDADWHFTGAAEYDAQGLDRGWFVHDAAQARKNEAPHAIYASSFQKTGLAFPLVWAPEIQWVSAVNVTDRYAQAAPAAAETVRVPIKVLDGNGKRVAVRVIIQDAESGKAVFEGTSKDETADNNDLLVFAAAPGHRYRGLGFIGDKTISSEFQTGTDAKQMIVLDLRQAASSATAKAPFFVPAPPKKMAPQLANAAQIQLEKALGAYFAATPEQRAVWKFAPELDRMILKNESAVRDGVWQAFRAAPEQKQKSDFDVKQVRFGDYLSAYTLKSVGTRPAGGWPLFIALHGGGGAPKEVNDSQWQMMQIYYKDHPELGGYRYLALRAPNDTWNGFYDDYVYPLVMNLIRQQLLFNDVDANKVFLIGYSHGGYGALAIGPKMPDRFAAIHASAAAPTDGETSAKTLRNTPFSVMVGENDTMYGRIERDRKFAAQIETLRGERKDIYPVSVRVMSGFGHGGLPDRDKIVEMYAETRNPVPHELTWEMTDGVIHDFFWLHTNTPGKNREINAVCRDNRLIVTTSGVESVSVLLDSRLVDFSKPLRIEFNGQKLQRKLAPSLKTLCATLAQRGDVNLAFSCAIDLP